jgi:predicted CxxxxCH...CXXCH cytochrome family protein
MWPQTGIFCVVAVAALSIGCVAQVTGPGGQADASPGGQADAGTGAPPGNGAPDAEPGFDQTCSGCHGDSTSPAPPRDLDGNTERTFAGVGAHRQHLGASGWHQEITCASCHTAPAAVDAPGHIDGDNQAELPFGALNRAATYTAATATCDNLYCHGNGRGDNGTMVWTEPGPLGCTSCHGTTGNTLSGRHGTHLGEGFQCVECHQDVVDRNRTIIGPARHVDGTRDVSIARGGTFDPAQRRCSNLACHGAEAW